MSSLSGELERARILEALDWAGGNQTEAAKLLGMARSTLIVRLDQCALPRVELERIAEHALAADQHAALRSFRDELRARS